VGEHASRDHLGDHGFDKVHETREGADVVRIGLVQINMGLTWSASSAEDDDAFGLLPYSVALLAAYARRNAREAHEFLVPIHRRVSVAAGVEHLESADLVGFSAYVWNVQASLAIARELKARRPETVIVFGGPQVPDRAEGFLREHPYVDIVCHGEGEATFTGILDGAPARDWADVRGVSYLEGGRFVHRPRGARIASMAELPSPFLEGEFDALMAAHPGMAWVAMWETNRGCPFSCSFCDWGSATASKVYRFEEPRLYAEIDWMAEHRIGFVFCCDANFGMLKRDYAIAERVVAAKERTGFPYSFSVQNTKNAIERGYKVQKLLNQSLNAYGATISLQSLSPQTLSNIKRDNISSDAFQELQRRFARDGVYTYTDLIIGLPGDTYDTFADGLSAVVAGGQHNHVQFHNCSVLPNAEMGQPAYQAQHGIRTVPQVIRNLHGRQDEVHEVDEYLDLVVETTTMPAEEWVRTKVFAWLTDFAYFDRVLQIPFAVLSARHDLPVRAFIELLTQADPERQPVIAGLHAELVRHAHEIAAGGPEYRSSRVWGNRLWPADQYALLTLVAEGRLPDFYREAGELIAGLLAGHGVTGEAMLLMDALTLNEATLKVPYQDEDRKLVLAHNLWEHYWTLLRGTPLPLREGITRYIVDRSTTSWATPGEWAEHLTWCQNKDKRGYLYTMRAGRGLGATQQILAAAA
jgi:hypothetical protein